MQLLRILFTSVTVVTFFVINTDENFNTFFFHSIIPSIISPYMYIDKAYTVGTCIAGPWSCWVQTFGVVGFRPLELLGSDLWSCWVQTFGAVGFRSLEVLGSDLWSCWIQIFGAVCFRPLELLG